MSSPSTPEAPTYELPEAIQGLDQQTIDLIMQGAGAQVSTPEEYTVASQALQGLLDYTPEEYSFQLPMDEIQQALAAQQAIQYEQYQEAINPIIAQQGQLDSTYYANLLGDYVQGQQAETYGTTADLLIQQATQDLAYQQSLSQWLPQFQSGVAGSLAGLGTNIAGLDYQNLTLPYTTTIPALQSQYNLGLNEAGQSYQADYQNYSNELSAYNQQQQQLSDLYSSLGSIGLGVATGGASIPFTTAASTLTSAGIGGTSGASGLTGSDAASLLSGSSSGLTGNYQYNPYKLTY